MKATIPTLDPFGIFLVQHLHSPSSAVGVLDDTSSITYSQSWPSFAACPFHLQFTHPNSSLYFEPSCPTMHLMFIHLRIIVNLLVNAVRWTRATSLATLAQTINRTALSFYLSSATTLTRSSRTNTVRELFQVRN